MQRIIMKKIITLTITICISQLPTGSCFPIGSSSLRRLLSPTSTNNARTHYYDRNRNDDDYYHDHHDHRLQMTNGGNEKTRRQALSKLVLTVSGISTSLISFSNPAVAKDELFKPNVLTNGFLEKLRILEQAEADNIQYNGELAPGSSPEKAAYVKMLIPILVIGRDIDEIDVLVHGPDGGGLEEAGKILSKPAFEKKTFKKTFNAFADNIYYSDPDRANLYLGGGATPKNEQSIAYLLRNDILTNVENLQAEVAYLIKERKAGNPLETEDLYLYAKVAKDGMKKYLDLVPPSERTDAEKMFSSS